MLHLQRLLLYPLCGTHSGDLLENQREMDLMPREAYAQFWDSTTSVTVCSSEDSHSVEHVAEHCLKPPVLPAFLQVGTHTDSALAFITEWCWA